MNFEMKAHAGTNRRGSAVKPLDSVTLITSHLSASQPILKSKLIYASRCTIKIFDLCESSRASGRGDKTKMQSQFRSQDSPCRNKRAKTARSTQMGKWTKIGEKQKNLFLVFRCTFLSPFSFILDRMFLFFGWALRFLNFFYFRVDLNPRYLPLEFS